MGIRYTERFRAAAFRLDEEGRPRLAKMYAGPLLGDESPSQGLRLIAEVEVPEGGFDIDDLEAHVRAYGWPERTIRVDVRLADVPSSGNQNYLAAKVFAEQRVAPSPERNVTKGKPRKSAAREPSVFPAFAEGLFRALADPETVDALTKTTASVFDVLRPRIVGLVADWERTRQEVRLEFHRRQLLEMGAASAPNPAVSRGAEPPSAPTAAVVTTAPVGGSDAE